MLTRKQNDSGNLLLPNGWVIGHKLPPQTLAPPRTLVSRTLAAEVALIVSMDLNAIYDVVFILSRSVNPI